MHAFGFWHEHQRPDRDRFVKIQEQFIKEYFVQDFAKHQNTITFGLPYDGLSMMHYQPWVHSINPNDPSKRAIVSKVCIGKWEVSKLL